MNFSKYLLAILVFSFSQNCKAQIYNWEWAYNYGGAGAEAPLSIDTGPTGILAVGGKVSNSYLPLGNTIVSCIGNNAAAFYFGIFNQDGSPRWGIGSNPGGNNTACTSIRFSPDGGIVAAGNFNGSPDPIFQYSAGKSICIIKTDTLGNWQWTTVAGVNPGEEYCYDMEVDNQGNIFISGYAAQGSIFGSFTLPVAGNYVAKLNPAGVFQWLTPIPGNYSEVKVTVDTMGNVYTCSWFQGTISFNAQTFQATQTDVLIGKFNSNSGATIWGKQITGSGYELPDDIAATSTGSIIVGGTFTTDVVAGLLVASSNGECFLAKIDSAGNYDGLKTFGGYSPDDQIFNIRYDNAGKTWLIARFGGNLSINGQSFQAFGGEKLFVIASLTESFLYSDIIVQPSTGNNNSQIYPYGIATNGEHVWMCGLMYYSMILPPFQLSSSNNDFLIAKLSLCQPPLISISSVPDSTLCQGDTVTLTANLQGNASLQWYENGNPISGATSLTYSTGSLGSYMVIATESYGCADTSNFQFLLGGSTPVLSILANGPTTICDGEAQILYTNIPFSSYLWSTGETTSQITVNQPGSYGVTVTNSDGCTGNSTPMTINNYPPVTLPTISESNCTLTVSPLGFIQYKWYFNGNVIQGVNTPTYNATAPGNYSVEVWDTNGCSAVSFSIQVNCPILEVSPQLSGNDIQTYPQPAGDFFEIQLGTEITNPQKWILRDIFGKIVAEGRIQSDNPFRIDCRSLSSGIYSLQVQGNALNITSGIVIFR